MVGKTRKKKAREKLAGREKGREREPPPSPLSPVSFLFIFVFALSQFSGPDYLGAWNRLLELQIKMPDFLSTRFGA